MSFSINGRQYSWTLLQISNPQLGKRTVTAQALSYSHGKGKTLQHGNGENPVGHTRDVYMVDESSLELLLGEADTWRSLMGPGYMDYPFDLAVSYSGDGVAPRTDKLIGCHIVKESPSSPKGTDAHKVTWSLQPDYLILGGVMPTIIPEG